MAIKWTREELEAMRLADEEIDEEEDFDYDTASKELEAYAQMQSLPPAERLRKEKRMQYQKKYEATHREARNSRRREFNAQQKKNPTWPSQQPEYVKAYRAQWYKLNKHRILAQQAGYYIKTRDARRLRNTVTLCKALMSSNMNITATAQVIGVTRPTVIARINKANERYQTDLFDIDQVKKFIEENEEHEHESE